MNNSACTFTEVNFINNNIFRILTLVGIPFIFCGITEDVDSQNSSANNDLILQKENEIHKLKQKQDELGQKHEEQMRYNVQLGR